MRAVDGFREVEIHNLPAHLALSDCTPRPDVQESGNPVSDTLRELVTRSSRNLVTSAELLPAEKYMFHPTPAQMTFAQLVVLWLSRSRSALTAHLHR
jgi:hypothetical protein